MPSQIRTRTVAPHKFQSRRLSLGQELRAIANRSGQPDAGAPLSPVVHRKRAVSIDNSQLDKCPRTLGDLCPNLQKAARLPTPTKSKKPCSLTIKTSSLLIRRMASDGGHKSRHLQVPVIGHVSSHLSVKSSVTRSQVLATNKAMAGIPSLETQSSRRTSRMNQTMPRYAATRTTRLHPIPTNQPTPVRLSMSPTTIRDPTFNAFGGLARFSSAVPKGMPTSPTDPTRTVPSAQGSFSSKNPLTPQNVQTATQFFPVYGHYIPSNVPGYYFPAFNGAPSAYGSQLGNPAGPFYQAPLSNRQYHQALGTNGTSLGSYYDEGLMQPGPYVGSLISNSISPGLQTQNNQFYYQIPLVNSTNDYQYITATNPNVRSQTPSNQAAWNYMNRVAPPNQTVRGYNNQGTVDLNTLPLSPSGNAIQRLQAEGAGVSPFRHGQFVYQTPGLTLPMDNNGVLYPVSSGQSGYQSNNEGLNVMVQSEPLSSPNTRNNGLQQAFPFLFSDLRQSPRKKMASLVSQNTERPGIHPHENQWISRPLSQCQNNFH